MSDYAGDPVAVEDLEGVYPEPYPAKAGTPEPEYKNDQFVTMGRIVRVKIDNGSSIESRVAIVTRVHSQNCVNLFVFLDGSVDYNWEPPGTTSILLSSVMYGDKVDEWRWPVQSA